MKQIEKDIKEQNLKSLYLLFGEEDYLRQKVKNQIKQAVIGQEPSLNYAYYEGKGVRADEVIAFADTMPFLASKRLVIVENSELNQKAPDEWIEYLAHVSDTCCLVLVEKKIDKRSRFYKACKKYGYATDLDLQKEAALISWAKNWLSENQCSMQDDVLRYFLGRVSNHMGAIEMELEKLRSYKWDEAQTRNRGMYGLLIEITKEDVDELSSQTVENKIFDMIDAATRGDQKKAFLLYYDLLSLKEAPMKILILLTRQINVMLQIKNHLGLHHENGEIAKAVGVHPFVVNKNLNVARGLSYDRMKILLALGVQMEEEIKTGRIKDNMAVEIFLSECCKEELSFKDWREVAPIGSY